MSAPKHRKTNSSGQLKILLPSISRKPSVMSIAPRSVKPSHRTSRSQVNISAAEKTGIGNFLNPIIGGILDIQGEIGGKLEAGSKMVDLAFEYYRKKQYESIIIIMEEFEASCLVYQLKNLVTGFYRAYTSILLELSEYSKCIIVCKKLLTEGMYSKDYQAIMNAYEKMGESFSKMKEFEDSLRNYFMMLKVALFIKDYKKELLAYDKIGLQYFNLNQLDRGEYFHKKMLEGKLEPDGSNLRKLSVIPNSVKILEGWHSSKPIEQEEQDLEELAMVFFEPMAVDPKYRELDLKRRKAFEYQDNLKNPIRRVGNVKVYGQSPDHIKIARAGYTLKPTNSPLSTLAHLSANRSVKVFDAISGTDNKGFFRFLKFGKQFTPYNRKAVSNAIAELKLVILDCQKKLIKPADSPLNLIF